MQGAEESISVLGWGQDHRLFFVLFIFIIFANESGMVQFLRIFPIGVEGCGSRIDQEHALLR